MIREILISIVFAAVIILGSLLSSFVLLFFLNSQSSKGSKNPENKQIKNKRKGLLLTCNVIFLVLGGLCGYIFRSIEVAFLMNLFLMLLIFAAGLLTGARIRINSSDSKNTGISKNEILKFLLLPPAIMIGSLGAAAILAKLSGIRMTEGLLFAAPMGWQTMGVPLIIQLTDVKTGTMAFNVNMFRDILSFLIIPFLGRLRHNELSISAGAASSMDILLPSITANSGKDRIMLSVWCGACCAFWAPFIIYGLALSKNIILK